MEKSNLSKIDNQDYGYNIPPELYKMRHDFCRDIVKGKCSENACPIYRKYYATGLSCTGALNQYPDECRELITANLH